MRKYSLSLVVSVVLILTTSLAMAAPRVWISKTGANKWTVYGEGLETIGGVDLTIRYETTLANPVVTNGTVVSGSVSMPNVAKPGVIRFAAISPTPFSKSSGDIAIITFGGGSGKVTGISSDLVTAHDNNPQKVANTAEVRDTAETSSTPGINTSTTSDTASTSTSSVSASTTTTSTTPAVTSASVGSSGQSTWLGGVSIQTDDASSRDRKEQPKQVDASAEVKAPEQSPVAEAPSEPEKKPADEKKAKKAQFVANTAVLDLFKGYSGERTPREMLSLFKAAASGYTQDPEIFLADGKKTLKLTIPVDTTATASPNFAISKEAQMASFPKIVDDTWVVELRPKKGVYQATLSYFLDEITTDIPVTVAPLLEKYDGKPFSTVSENDLVRFLSKTEASKTDLSRDLNGDTLVDYIDDFIFIANYLIQAAQTKPSEKQDAKGKDAQTPKKDEKTEPKLKTPEKPEPKKKTMEKPIKKTDK